MTVSTLEFVHSLQDPLPPVPGNDVRATVHARATQIRRRHRATAALATVSCAAFLVIGVLAVANTGTATRERVDTAAAPPAVAAPTVVDTAAPASAAPAAAPADDTARSDVAGTAATSSDPVDPPAASGTAQITVTVGERSVPAGVELDATLTGDGGTFSAHLRTPGTLSFAQVPTGDYQLRWSWVSDDGTAEAAGRVPVHVDPGEIATAL